MRHGPRFSGGYQFPYTDSARLERGEPIRELHGPGGARLAIVPLRGGRRKAFDVCAFYEEEPGRWVSHSYVAYDELEAREWFRRLARKVAP
jgi:hypothetical protein